MASQDDQISPGDVVREKHSGIDFVVQSVVGLAAVGGLTVYAINVYDNSIRVFNTENIGVLREIVPVWRNLRNLHPDQVLEMESEVIARLAKLDKKVLEKLTSGDRKFTILKDLGSIISRAEEGTTISSGLIKIAKILVEGFGEMHEDDIRKAIVETVGDEIHPRHLEELVSIVKNEMVTSKGGQSVDRAISEASATISAYFKDHAILSDLGFGPILKGDIKGFIPTKEATFFFKYFMGSGKGERSGSVLSIFDQSEFFGNSGERTTAGKAFAALGLKLLNERGRVGTDKTRAVLESWGDKMDVPTLSRIMERTPGFMEATRSVLSYHETVSSRDLLAKSQYNKSTSVERARDRSFTRGRIPLKTLAGMPDVDPVSGLSRVFSIDTNTFIHEVLRGRTFSYEGEVGSMGTNEVLASKVYQLLRSRNKSQSVFARPQDLRRFFNETKAGRIPNIDQLMEVHEKIANHLDSPDELYKVLSDRHGIYGGEAFYANKARVVSTLVDPVKLEHAIMNKPLEAPKPSPGNMMVYFHRTQEDSLITSNLSALRNLGVSDSSIRYLEIAKKAGLLKELKKVRNLRDLEPSSVVEGASNSSVAAMSSPLPTTTVTLADLKDAERTAYRIRAAREEGRTQAFMAYSSLRDKSGKPILVATEVNIPLDQQIMRARKYFREGGGALDIETPFRTTKDGREKFISQITLREGEKTIFERIGLGDNPRNDAEALIALAQSLEEKGDEFVIGTHTAYDFKLLIEKAQKLYNDARSQDASLDTTSARLSGAVETFERVSKKQGFGTEIILGIVRPQMALNQNAHNLRELEKLEGHTATGDTSDLVEILRRYGEEFTSASEDIKLFSKRLNMTMFGSDRAGPAAGKFIRLREIVPFKDLSENPKVAVVFENLELKNGKLVRTGIGDQFTGSPYGVRGMLSGMEIVSETSLESQRLKQETIIKDIAGRYLRGLNPLTESYWDTSGVFDPETMGMFSATDMRVKKIVGDLLPQALKLRNKEGGDKREAANVVASRLVAGLNLAENADLAKEVMGNSEHSAEVLKIMIHNQMVSTLTDDVERKALYGKDSPYAKFLGSEMYDAIISPLRKGFGVEGEHLPGSSELTDYTSQFRRVFILGRAAEEGLTKTYTTDPRFSVRVGKAVAAINFSDRGVEAEGFDKMLNRLSSELTIQGGLDERTREILIKSKTITKEQGEWLETNISNWLGVNTRTSLREKYERIAQMSGEIPHEEGGKFGELSDIFKKIKGSRLLKMASLSSLQEKLGRFEEGSDEMIKGSAMIQDIRNRMTSEETANEIFSTTIARYAYDPISGEADEAVTNLFRDRLVGQIDIPRVPDWFKGETGKEVIEEADAVLGSIAEKGFVEGGLRNRHLAVPVSLIRAMELRKTVANEGKTEVEQNEIVLEFLRSASQRGLSAPTEDELKRVGVWDLGKLREIDEATRINWIKAVNKATAAASGDESMAERIVQHKALLRASQDIPSIAEGLKHVGMPLMAIAGVAGLMLAAPPRNDEFTQGEQSSAAGQTPIGRYSEIPGPVHNTRVWLGNTDPFRVDITFKGFVASKDHQEELVRQVYNNLNGHMEFQSVHTDIRDERLMSHKEAARKTLERNL